MRNPIIKELLRLKIVDLKNCSIISPITRDKKINVFLDKKSGVIFLEKYVRHEKYYESDRNMSKKKYSKIHELFK